MMSINGNTNERPTGPTVVVTGATGLVGSRLCDWLLDKNYNVRAVVRENSRATHLPAVVERIEVGDLCSSAIGWDTIVAGSEAILHLAARTHVLNETSQDSLTKYRRINVDVTKRIMSAACRQGVSRFVYLSSIKAVGEGSVSRNGITSLYTEETTCDPQDGYGISKREAEISLLATSADGATAATVIRPPLVYGPQVQGNLLRLIKAVQRGIPLPLASVKNQRSLVYVENLCSAIVTAMVHPAAAGEIFHIADNERLSTTDLLRQLASHQSRSGRLYYVPASILRALATMVGQGGAMSRLTGSLVVSIEKAEQMLQWRPPYSSEVGLQQMTQSFVACEQEASRGEPKPSPTIARGRHKSLGFQAEVHDAQA